MLSSLRDNLTFFRNFRKRFETTGSIVPSSQSLARSMTRFLAKRGDAPVRVLEIGPGTGPVTRRIVTHLREGDVFDLVELNEEFANVLQRKFETEPTWKAVAELSTIHQLPLQDFAPAEGYDFIISGLPMANFAAEMVEELSDKYFEVLKPEGVLSYFEYMYVRPIRKVVTAGSARTRITRIDDIMNGHIEQRRIARDNVFINVPPAWVQHLNGTPHEADGAAS